MPTNDMKFKFGHTERGFPIIWFFDRYDAECTIQKSSLAFEDAIWIGPADADPRILASKTPQGGRGCVPYPIPDDVFLSTRMHLTRQQVAALLPILETFVETGELPNSCTDMESDLQ